VILRWSSLFGPNPSEGDARLAAKAAFYLLIPPSVALHELGHAALVWAQGSEVKDWFFLGYMGAVVHASLGPIGDFAVAVAGNAVTLLIGIGAILFGVFLPGGRSRNILAIELGRQSSFLVLVFYPLLCLGFPGDFVTIYAFSQTPIASAITAFVHATVIVFGWGVLWRRWRPRVALLVSHHADRFVELERRVKRDPEDLGARRGLGLLLLEAGDSKKARIHLEYVAKFGADAALDLALGLALLESGEPQAALQRLESVAPRLFHPDQRRLAEEAIARARSTPS
jgi:hypothetical protein